MTDSTGTQSDWVTGPTGTQSPSRGLKLLHPYLRPVLQDRTSGPPVLCSTLVYTFVEDETVNRRNYLQMLKSYPYSIMQRKRLNSKMFFQQDGVLPHFSEGVRT